VYGKRHENIYNKIFLRRLIRRYLSRFFRKAQTFNAYIFDKYTAFRPDEKNMKDDIAPKYMLEKGKFVVKSYVFVDRYLQIMILRY